MVTWDYLHTGLRKGTSQPFSGLLYNIISETPAELWTSFVLRLNDASTTHESLRDAIHAVVYDDTAFGGCSWEGFTNPQGRILVMALRMCLKYNPETFDDVQSFLYS